MREDLSEYSWSFYSVSWILLERLQCIMDTEGRSLRQEPEADDPTENREGGMCKLSSLSPFYSVRTPAHNMLHTSDLNTSSLSPVCDL